MSESILIDDIEYNIEDEELEEVSYYEILSLDEIIKDNPTFVAFSREEIVNELDNIFKDSDKSHSLAELFYKDKSADVTNVVFVGDVEKTQNDCKISINEKSGEPYCELEGFFKYMEKMNKQQHNISREQKNKYFFALAYDANSKAVRLKPYMKTIIGFQDDNKQINVFYPVFAEDDTNIPILAAYYKQPITTMFDYMSDKVLSHTIGKPKLFNYVDAESYSDIDKLISVVKPKMKLIIDKMQLDKEDYDLDHNHIDNMLRKFDTSLDEINMDDFQLLREKLEDILDTEPIEIKYKGRRIKDIKYTNEKLTFYDKIKNIGKLLDIPEKVKEDYELLIASLQEQKFQLSAPPLIYNNVNDIVNAVTNNDVAIEDIIDNIDSNRKVIVFDHAITTLKNINANDATNIQEMLDDLIVRFSALKEIKNDLYELHFLDFYKELVELREGNDYSDYEGIPDIFKNEAKFDEQGGFGDIDVIDDTEALSVGDVSKMTLEKHWLSTKYKEAKGFTEMLQIVLPIVYKIKQISKLDIDFDLLSNELYRHFVGVPTKYNTMYNLFKKHKINESDDYIRNVTRLTPRVALSETVSSEYEQFKDVIMYIKECNEEFVKTLADMIHTSIAWWSIRVQDDIIEGINAVEENLFDPTYVDRWSLNGQPLKESSKGVAVYLSAITKDVVLEETEYFSSKPKDTLKIVTGIIKDTYSNEVKELIENNKNIAKRENKGSETYKALMNTFKEKNKDQLLVNYINALVYMPGYKYKKINKFLLGCCLQKIGKDFVAFSDLKERKDLMMAKAKYSKKRETMNISKTMFCPTSDKQTSKTQINYMLPIIKMDDRKTLTVEKWLDDMKNVSPLLPEKIITIFQTNPRNSQSLSEENISIFCKTAGAKGKTTDFKLQLYNTSMQHSNILRRICTVMKRMDIDRTVEESGLLSSSIDVINSIIQDVDRLHEIVDEHNMVDIRYIKYYILTRVLCLPFNPDIAKDNNGVLYSSVKTSHDFVNQVTKNVYGTITKYMISATMPTIEENLNFINKIREESKKATLDVLNMKSNEERGLIDQLKKYGMKQLAEELLVSEPGEYVDGFTLNGIYDNNYGNDEMQDEFLMISQEEDEQD